MRYIIERPIDSLNKKTSLSYLVDSEKISYVSQSPLKMNVMKMNVHGFKMIPGYITSFTSINTLSPENVNDLLFQKLTKGTTTLLTSAKINYLHEADQELKRTRHLLISSPIDYCIGLTLTPARLTPDVVTYCKQKKLPFIELICHDFEELSKVIWERIRDANFPYQAVIYPKFVSRIDDKTKKVWQKKWNDLASKFYIPTFYQELDEEKPIPLPFLKSLGIYPEKGGLFFGSDVDYCLIKNNVFSQLPSTVVIRGRVIYNDQNTINSKGYGKELIISLPSRFGESHRSRV